MADDTPPEWVIDKSSPTWQAVERKVRDNLKDAINKLKTQGNGNAIDEYQKGRIKELETILELPEQEAKARAGMRGPVRQSPP